MSRHGGEAAAQIITFYLCPDTPAFYCTQVQCFLLHAHSVFTAMNRRFKKQIYEVLNRRKTTNLYFPDGVDCEHEPYPQQQTYQTDEVEERQDGPGLEHGSPGGQPLLFEGRVVGPPGEGLDLFCIHHRGPPQQGNMNSSGLKNKTQEGSARPSIALLYSSDMSQASLWFRLPRGFPSRLCRAGEMITACYLLTINYRCLFSFPSHGDQVLLFSMP